MAIPKTVRDGKITLKDGAANTLIIAYEGEGNFSFDGAGEKASRLTLMDRGTIVGCRKENDHDFIGKEALRKIQSDGIKQQIRGVIFDGEPYKPTGVPLPVYSKDDKKIGQIASGIYSPRIKKNIGLSMIKSDFWETGNEVFVNTFNGKNRKGIITSLPFPD